MIKLISKRFAEKLRQTRKSKGYNLSDFAEVLEIPKAELWEFENRGATPLDISILSKMALVLDVTIYWLIQDNYEEAPVSLIRQPPIYRCVWCRKITNNTEHICARRADRNKAVVR